EPVDKRDRILSEQDRLETVVGWFAGGRISAHERRYRAETSPGQDRQQMTVSIGVIGKSMQTQDQWAGPKFDKMEVDVVRGHVASPKFHQYLPLDLPSEAGLLTRVFLPQRVGLDLLLRRSARRAAICHLSDQRCRSPR